MNLSKLFRNYLIFILVITGMSTLTYSETFNSFSSQFLSVLHISKNIPTDVSSKKLNTAAFEPIAVNNPASTFKSQKENSGILNFEITSDPENSFAEPGDREVEIMRLVFKSKNEAVSVNGMKLKIEGVSGDALKKVYLAENDNFVTFGQTFDEYIVFRYVNYEVKAGDKLELSIVADLSEDLKTNDRIRLDIESADDISITVGGKPYQLSGYYPIRGKYLTIAKPRFWNKTLWKLPQVQTQ